MGQISEAISLLISPALAGAMLVPVCLEGYLLVGFASFVFAIAAHLIPMLLEITTPDLVEYLVSFAGIGMLDGLLVDNLFTPFLDFGSSLNGSVGRITSVEPHLGNGFLYVILGFATILVSSSGYLNPRVRFFED